MLSYTRDEKSPLQLHARAYWAGRLQAIAEWVSWFLDRHRYAVLILFLMAYLGATCYRASRKLFWNDEIFTLYISRLPGLGAMWDALSKGADLNPPLLYELIRLSTRLFGEGHVATRLPAILGFGIFCLALFRFVSARTNVLGGLAAMLFPMVTTAYWYAYEARSHGVVLGFAGAALICWQAAASRSDRRVWWIIGLGVALACGLLVHSYAVLLFVPFVTGELARSIRTKRIDWPIWVALVAASSAILPSLVLLRRISPGGPQTFYPASLIGMLESYGTLLSPAIVVISVAFWLFCIGQSVKTRRGETSNLDFKLPTHELVAVLTLIALPAFSYLIAKAAVAPVLARYSVAAVGGFACVLGIAAAKRAAIGVCALLMLVGQIGVDLISFSQRGYILEPTTNTPLSTHSPWFMRHYAVMASAEDKESPIVVLDNLEYMPILHYAPEELVSRLTYVIWNKSDVNGQAYVALRKCCGGNGNVMYLSDFRKSHDRFLVYGPQNWTDRRVASLIESGAIVTVLSVSGNNILVSVSFR